MSSMSGKRLGDYEIIGELGEGAMGKVYLARNALLPAIRVVLKILKDARQKERFLAEATNLSRLGHRNICQLKHFFHSEGDLIIAMEYIDGKSLGDLAKEWKEIDLARVKSVILQVLDGLDHAHRMGVCHRDIKPSNVMLDKHGVVKIIDFGIARHGDDPRYTRTGLSVGTPQYMAPEQFTEERIGDYSLCDIYSLGVCLYQLCCGRLPFEDTNPFILKDKHCLEMPPSPSSLNKDIYFSLEKVIKRAMAKRPWDRFPNAAAMRAELAAAERGSDPLTGGSFLKHEPDTSSDHQALHRQQVAAIYETAPHGRADQREETKPGEPAGEQPPPDITPRKGPLIPARSRIKVSWLYAMVVVAGLVAAYVVFRNPPPRPPTAELRFVLNTWATVTVDDSLSRSGTVVVFHLRPGNHSYKAEASCCRGTKGNVSLAAGGWIEQVDLVPVDLVPIAKSKVTFILNVSARVEIAGVEPKSGDRVHFELDPRTYQYEVTAAGYTPVQDNFELRAGDTTKEIPLELVPLTTKLTFALNTWATVTVDDTVEGSGTEVKFSLPSGNHSYRAEAPGYGRHSGNVFLSTSGRTERVDLVPTVRPKVTLVINAHAQVEIIRLGSKGGDSVRVAIDSAACHIIPKPDEEEARVILELDPGSYRYEVKAEGYDSRQGSFQVGAGEAKEIPVQLPPLKSQLPTARLTFMLNTWARVTVDGKLTDTGMVVRFKLPPRNHTFRAEAPGYDEFSGNVFLPDTGKTVPVSLESRKSRVTFVINVLARVEILGIEPKEGDTVSFNLEPRTYQYVITAEKYEAAKDSLVLKRKDSKRIDITLEREKTFDVRIDYPMGRQPVYIIAVDLNGDASVDLIVANRVSNDIRILIGRGDGTFQPAASYKVPNPVSVVATDLDGDGTQDLVVANEWTDELWRCMNKGDGSFNKSGNLAVSYDMKHPVSVVAADFDKDGNMDVAAANASSNNVSILRNEGFLPLRKIGDYATGNQPICVCAADLDGDGDLDLAVANRSSHSVSILKNNGDATFQNATRYQEGDPVFVLPADLDKDGDYDLIVVNENRDEVAVLKNNGDGTFRAAGNYAVGAGPRSACVADLDGDGALDLAVANQLSNKVSFLKNNGDGTFQRAIDFSAGRNPSSIVAGDFDGDGDIDLAVTNLNANKVSILRNKTK